MTLVHVDMTLARTLRRMLSESDGKNVDSGMPVRAPTKMESG